MTSLRLVLRSLRYYFKRNLMVVTGIAVTTAVLSGALFIGDSIRYSLEQITLSRLGTTSHVVAVNDRFFRSALAEDISVETGYTVAPVLILEGMAVADGGQRRINNVQISGIDDRFRMIAGTGNFIVPGKNEAIISENLARKLDVKEGDELLLRIGKASLVPKNAPFVPDVDNTVSLRVNILSVVGPEFMGGFNLKNSQIAPFNVFLSLERLNRLMEFEGRANRLLVSGEISREKLIRALDKTMLPADGSLLFKKISLTGEYEISTERIFLEDKVAAVLGDLPGSRPVMTYFVNKFEFEGKEVPYSFVSALPDDTLTDNEIIVNEWLADDLSVKAGDSLQMVFYEIGPLRQLKEKETTLVVKEIVPIKGKYADSTLMPAIPGLSDAGHCREWEAGVPISLDKIRDKDEVYWNQYKGTPKAFVSPGFARKFWSNRFGNLTSIRIPGDKISGQEFQRLFAERFTASDFGFSVVAVREEGLRAARGGVNFGELFLGLSFFLMLAALLLTALFFMLNLGNRTPQAGTMLQLGFTKSQIRKLFLTEALLLAIPGVAGGLLLAVGYVRLIFAFMNSLWWDMVRTSMLSLRIEPLTLMAGALISLFVSSISTAIPLNRFLNRNVVRLQHQLEPSGRSAMPGFARWIVPGVTGIALVLVCLQFFSGNTLDPALFFLSGGLLLAGFLFWFYYLLSFSKFPVRHYSLQRLVFQNMALNRGRSLTIVVLFALSTFLVISTGANRKDLNEQNNSSGTGGFTHFAETTVPVLYDLNDLEKRRAENLDTSFRVVQFHKISGDDASCLNLNKIENPALLGMNAGELSGRFSFVTFSEEADRQDPWQSLKDTLPGGIVPCIADQTVIQWGLMMKVGDTLLYQGEAGDTLRLKLIAGLAPSILQGYVLIDNAHFLKYFPTHSGTSLFLAEIAAEIRESVVPDLENIFRDNGITIATTRDRLAEFLSVTNTYLSVFLILGALGLLLGTIGLSVVVARSVMERSRELGTMLAIGFSRTKVIRYLITEYGFLLISGVGIGFISAITAVLPGLIAGKNPSVAWTSLAITLIIIMHGLFWIFRIAGSMVKPGNVIPALRQE